MPSKKSTRPPKIIATSDASIELTLYDANAFLCRGIFTYSQCSVKIDDRRRNRQMKPVSDTQKETWHALEAAIALDRLASNAERGLTSDEAMRRLDQHGPNRLPEGAKRGPWIRFLQQFDNVLVYVLLAAGFVKLMLGLWLDASVIMG